MLASCVPAFRIPERTWRGQAIAQYQPTGLEEQYKYRKDPHTHKQVLDYSFKQVGKTLINDHYRALAPDDCIVWIWDSLTLSVSHTALLRQLLKRIQYFGRAESFCLFELADTVDTNPNCFLSPQQGRGSPVLVSAPNPDLNVLLAATDDKLITRRRIPPGSAWYYASIPPCPAGFTGISHRVFFPENLKLVQFAVGGRVLPPASRWVKITERFRGKVLRICAQELAGDVRATYRDLAPSDRDTLMLLCGKDARGEPLGEHEHAYFCLWPDKNGLPTRLICWRSIPFTQKEIEALLIASEYPYSWDYGNADWMLKMVPIPFGTPPPPGFFEESDTWVSVTPFVPPWNRRRFRGNGRERPGERPERLVEKLLRKCGFPAPDRVEILDDVRQHEWVVVHATRIERTGRSRERTTKTMPGYRMKIFFGIPIKGPLALGDSAHFGLGLFAPQS
jgi:CRISPR-associated protein Csb2